ncbi:MAG: hypothetical protein ACTSPA_12420 [Promethearchaeota archaeon]
MISSSNNSPLSGSGSNLDYIEMNYYIEYEIVKNGVKNKDSIPLKLIVNGTEDIYENGTISYYIGKNVTDDTVLQLLSNVFIDSQMNFFKNHNIEESYQTFFSYRREALSNNISAFLTNASYSLFWIFLGINDENRIISDKTWSDEKSELSKNVRILNSFYLKANFNNEQIINLYYDKTWTILLRGKFENYDSTEDKYILDIKLVDSNLDLDFLPDNPFWDVRLRNLLIFIPLSSVVGVIIAITFIKKSRNQKKEDILDKI